MTTFKGFFNHFNCDFFLTKNNQNENKLLEDI